MLGTLIRKQFMEISQLYTVDRKTGKRRGKTGTAAYLFLFVLLFFLMGVMVYQMSGTLAIIMLGQGTDWLFFAFMGIITIVLGIFGSVFSTYASLFLAKDNDFLLSMPIPPSTILLSRMTGVFASSLFFTAVGWIPSVIRYVKTTGPGIGSLVCSILMLPVITVLVSALCCLFGWLVALLSKKAKGKSYITVIISLVFIGGYYYLYSNVMGMLTGLAGKAESLSRGVKGFAYPLYLMGEGACGKIIPLIAFTVISAAALLICWKLMSVNFIKITGTSAAAAGTKFKEAQIKATGIKKALFKRELKRFTGSAVYMLNCGLGLLFLIAAPVFAILKQEQIDMVIQLFEDNAPQLLSFKPLLAALVICSICSMNCISTPSVSLEGKNLWIVKSLPVSAQDILKAKELLHIVLNSVPAVLCSLGFSIALRMNFDQVLSTVLFVLLFIELSADCGLAMGILKANLTWTNEAVPVKQSLSVVIVLFGGILFNVAIGAGAVLLRNRVGAEIYMAACILIFAFLIKLLRGWLMKEGAKRFTEL